ncbi:organic cation transporter-like protein [Tubulanus polymorphus]|uniref:organic cation transporter-like protein n=1 Tax=Tubulanus polymorphus TaxID=672921 RepID=UPI003DA6C909
MDLEERLIELGNRGRYQIVSFILYGFNYMTVVFQHLGMVMYARDVEYRCNLPTGADPNISVPVIERGGKLIESHCTINNYAVTPNGQMIMNATSKCDLLGWNFPGIRHMETMANTWLLVCDKAYLNSLMISVYFLCAAIGGVVFGHLADRWGRKPLIFIPAILQALFAVGVYFSTDFTSVAVWKGLQGFFEQGILVTNWVICVELFGQRIRPIAGITVYGVFWVLGYLWMLLMYMLVVDWKLVHLILSIPAVTIVVYIWWLGESPLWLLHKGNLDACRNLIRRAARTNKNHVLSKHLDPKHCPLPSKKPDISPESGCCSIPIATNKHLRNNMLAMFLITFCVWWVYYDLAIYPQAWTNHVIIDRIINIAPTEIPISIVLPIILFKRTTISRKNVLITFLLSMALVLSVAAALPNSSSLGDSISKVRMPLVLVGKFFISGCMALCFLFAVELSPTSGRATFMGRCLLCGALAVAICVQIQRILSASLYPRSSYVVDVALGIVATWAAFILPNYTALDPMPETAVEANHVGRRKWVIHEKVICTKSHESIVMGSDIQLYPIGMATGSLGLRSTGEEQTRVIWVETCQTEEELPGSPEEPIDNSQTEEELIEENSEKPKEECQTEEEPAKEKSKGPIEESQTEQKSAEPIEESRTEEQPTEEIIQEPKEESQSEKEQTEEIMEEPQEESPTKEGPTEEITEEPQEENQTEEEPIEEIIEEPKEESQTEEESTEEMIEEPQEESQTEEEPIEEIIEEPQVKSQTEEESTEEIIEEPQEESQTEEGPTEEIIEEPQVKSQTEEESTEEIIEEPQEESQTEKEPTEDIIEEPKEESQTEEEPIEKIIEEPKEEIETWEKPEECKEESQTEEAPVEEKSEEPKSQVEKELTGQESHEQIEEIQTEEGSPVDETTIVHDTDTLTSAAAWPLMNAPIEKELTETQSLHMNIFDDEYEDGDEEILEPTDEMFISRGGVTCTTSVADFSMQSEMED